MKKAFLRTLSLLVVFCMLILSAGAVELTKEMIESMSPAELLEATGLSADELRAAMAEIMGDEAPVPPGEPAEAAPAAEAAEATGGVAIFADAADIKNVEAVNKLIEMKAIDGIEKNGKLIFDPKANITREAMAKIVAVVVSSLKSEQISEVATSKFTDVGSRWSAKYVDYCVDKGIVSGRGNNVFDYSSSITVTETAKLLLAYMGFKNLTGENWANTVYNYASMSGLLSGISGANVDPITRDEAALMIYTALELIKSGNLDTIIANIGSGTGIGGGQTGGQTGGSGVPAPPPGGGGMVSFSFSTPVTALESKTYDSVVFPDSTNSKENAVQARGEVTAVLNKPTITKTAGDASGDACSFYGINAGVMAGETANLTINGGTVTTSASGANGVFSYGEATVTVKDLVVRTSKGGSGGIMAAGGGTLYAYNCDVETQGGSAAAIRSDRGGGTMRVDGGTYISHGGGSPAIYVTADIEVKNATLQATAAQGVVIEGKNSVSIIDCDLSGDVAATGTSATDDDEKSNIMVMQSFSGDSAIGTAQFSMTGGTLTAKSGNMFYTTNTHSIITIKGVEMVYAENNNVFLIAACNENSRKWGTPGKNGANCEFTADSQVMKGEIIYDTASTLNFKMQNGSALTGFFTCRDWYTGEGGATVTVDKTSTLTITGDSVITKLIIEDGATVTASKMTVAGVETPIAPGTYENVVLYK